MLLPVPVVQATNVSEWYTYACLRGLENLLWKGDQYFFVLNDILQRWRLGFIFRHCGATYGPPTSQSEPSHTLSGHHKHLFVCQFPQSIGRPVEQGMPAPVSQPENGASSTSKQEGTR